MFIIHFLLLLALRWVFLVHTLRDQCLVLKLLEKCLGFQVYTAKRSDL